MSAPLNCSVLTIPARRLVAIVTTNVFVFVRANTDWQRLRGLTLAGDYEALTQGFTFHLALEMYYKAVRAHQRGLSITAPQDAEFQVPPEAERAAWDAIEPLRKAEGYEKTYGEIERMLASYFDLYRAQDRWRVIDVEVTLAHYTEAFEYSARLDLLVEDIDRGGTWIVEHKTARAFTEDLITGYQMDQQILGQAWLLKHCIPTSRLGDFRGVLINLTSKHKSPQHMRIEVMPSDRHLEEFVSSLSELACRRRFVRRA